MEENKGHKKNKLFSIILPPSGSLSPSPVHQNHNHLSLFLPSTTKEVCFTMSMLVTYIKERGSQLFQSPGYTQTDEKDEEADYYEEDHRWFSKIDKEALSRMIKEKDVEFLCQAGGVQGVALALGSELKQGISGGLEDLRTRLEVFGSNTNLETPIPEKSFLRCVVDALKDVSVVMLLCSTVISLVVGIRKDGWKDGWFNGVTIFLSLVAIVTVTAVCNFRHAKLFKKKKCEGGVMGVSVIRAGERKQVSICDIVVGDIVQLRTGGDIPADGLLLPEEKHMHMDHEDDSIMVKDGDNVYAVDQLNPFLTFGTKVVEGRSLPYKYPPYMLITTVGANTTWGTSCQPNKQSKTSFQAQFNQISSYKENISLLIAFILLVVSFVDCFTLNTNEKQNASSNKSRIYEVINAGLAVIQEHKVRARSLATTATAFLLAIPEGFALVVTLLIVYSRNQLMRTVQVRVQKLFSCVTAAYVTTIVTDKTSFLMMNRMKVAEFRLSQEVIDASTLPPKIREIMCQGIGLNMSSILLLSPEEKALLSWAETALGMNIEEVKRISTVLYVDASSSRKKGAGVWIRKTGEDGKAIDVHWKGSSKIILARCTHYYEGHGIRELMSKDKWRLLDKVVEDMEANGLQCMALAHKQVIEGKKGESITEATFPLKKESKMLYERGLTLLGLVGLEYKCHPNMKTVTEECRNAGTNIIMISKDDILAAKSLATRVGIVGADSHISKMVTGGEYFQSCSTEERMKVTEQICVLTNSSPSDKVLLVQSLRKKGEVVAVTGVGMSDALVFEQADLRLSMGIRSIQIINGISDVVIMDDNFSSITAILRRGRFTHDTIQKFIQLTLTSNIAGLTINFIATVCFGEDAPFTTLQMLLVNLIVDCMGALALAHEPTRELVMTQPVAQNEPLITNLMWRNILGQVLFQIVTVLTLQFKGKALFTPDGNFNKALVFNTFVLCQCFNLFNSRKLKEKNVFSGFDRNIVFWGVIGGTLVLQVVVTELLGKLFNMERLNLQQWGSCITMAAVSWPVGLVTKYLPVPDLRLNPSLKGCFTGFQHKIRVAFCRWNRLKPISQSLPLVNAKDV